jgi:hypothetical protein
MSATATLLKVESRLTFGVPVLTTCVLQDIKADRNANTAKATGEQGAVIGIAIFGGQDAECSGSYLYCGTQFGGGIGANIATQVGTAVGLTGPVAVSGFGIARTHEGFVTGDFKAVSLDSATYTAST